MPLGIRILSGFNRSGTKLELPLMKIIFFNFKLHIFFQIFVPIFVHIARFDYSCITPHFRRNVFPIKMSRLFITRKNVSTRVLISYEMNLKEFRNFWKIQIDWFELISIRDLNLFSRRSLLFMIITYFIIYFYNININVIDTVYYWEDNTP